MLRFAVEYVGKYDYKDKSANNLDIEVEDIDTKELLESPKRLEKIVDYMLLHHKQKTKWPDFNAMFCVSSIETLTKYYELFKAKQAGQAKPLKIATIFSYTANEENPLANGLLEEESPDVPSEAKINQSSRDKLDEYIADYNAMFGTKYSTNDSQSFYNYYQDIAKRVRSGEIDILLVVNMFLTGFDSPRTNTLFVDKNLRYHGLLQAFSRTNRLLNEKKSHGNIVCFRNLKQATDDAIALFSNKDAKEVVIVKPYDDYVKDFNKAVTELVGIAPTIQSIDSLADEEEQKKFVIAFRELLRLKNILTTFAEYQDADLKLEPQAFEDYKSKYLDIHEKKTHEKEKVSILDDVDFELALIHKDEINVAYILGLLKALQTLGPEDSEKRKKQITDIITGEVTLRKKRKLIEAFIQDNLPKIKKGESLEDHFAEFWGERKREAFVQLCEEERIQPEQLGKLINNYEFANREPREEEIIGSLTFKPKILERKTLLQRIADKIRDFIETFIDGMGGTV